MMHCVAGRQYKTGGNLQDGQEECGVFYWDPEVTAKILPAVFLSDFTSTGKMSFSRWIRKSTSYGGLLWLQYLGTTSNWVISGWSI